MPVVMVVVPMLLLPLLLLAAAWHRNRRHEQIQRQAQMWSYRRAARAEAVVIHHSS